MPRRSERQAEIRAHEETVEYYNALSERRQRSYMPDFVDGGNDEDSSEGEADLDAWTAREEMRQEEEMLEVEIDMELNLMDEQMRIQEAFDEFDDIDIGDDNGGDPHESPRANAERRLEYIQAHRYRFRNQYRTERPHATWYQHAMQEDGRDLRSMFRMDPASLDRVVSTLRTHSVYQQRGPKPQKDPQLQIGVALYYFGGTCNKHRIATIFGISSGSVQNFIDRFITAVLSLQEEYMSWPEPHTEQYRAIVQKHLIQYGLPECLGFVDGTMIPLWRKPDGPSGGFYFTRKKIYAINLSIIVDSERRILFAVTGRKIRCVHLIANCLDTGTMHDSAVLNASDFYGLPEGTFFEDPTGYIIGDSAYRLTNRVMKPFSEPQLKRGDHAERDNRKFFNRIVSSARVNVEHAFGAMKCRFPALSRLHLLVGLGAKNKEIPERVESQNKRVSVPFPLGGY
jgi:hypothetical protein